MIFIEKEENNCLEYGDFVLLKSGQLLVAVIDGELAKLVDIDGGEVDSEFTTSYIKDLQEYIDKKYPSARIIKSENIEIREV